MVDVRSHLFPGMVIDRGPKGDDLEFRRLTRQAHRRHPFDALLGDVGYDGEHHHRFLYYELGVLGIIPPQRGRPTKTPPGRTRAFFRQFLRDHWYGQLARRKGANIAKVPAARRLLTIVYRVLKDNRDYQLDMVMKQTAE